MARCPNCGRETRRTIDWCCQWCGYPLFSGSYKKIDKTYKELKDERTGTVSDNGEPDVEDEVIDEAVIEECSKPLIRIHFQFQQARPHSMGSVPEVSRKWHRP